MIHSMTGFGSASFRVAESGFDIEVRSVNHRHLDARVRLPRTLAHLEPDFRGRIQARFARGKIDCNVVTPASEVPAPRVTVDLEAARRYLRAAAELAREEGVSGQLSVADLLALPGVAGFAEPEIPVDALNEAALSALDRALDGLEAMRAREGEAIARDLRQRVARVAELVVEIEERSGQVQDRARERLRKRARQLESETGLLDEARLHQEVVLAADRLDVSEEIVRLRSHVEQFRSVAEGGGAGSPVGRRLEFLLQELGREANTIGSKGADAPVAHRVVELKSELERLREQVLNVE
jgi:uncharacterized protein (TIGR00255 family)